MTETTDDRVALARRLYVAFRSADWDAARDCFADDAHLGFAGRSPMAGYFDGGANVAVSVLRDMVDRSGGTFRPVLDDGWDVCSSDHHVIVFDWFRAERADTELKVYLYFVIAVESGKIARMFVHSSEQYEFDEFFAER